MRWALLLAMLASGCVGATEDGGTEAPAGSREGGGGCVRAVLVDEAVRPIPGAHVQIPEIGWATVTDGRGSYGYEGVPPGNHTVVATWDGGTKEWRVHVRDGCSDFLQEPR